MLLLDRLHQANLALSPAKASAYGLIDAPCNAAAQAYPGTGRRIRIVCSCAVLFAQIARETAGAACTRSSLRPLFSRGQKKMQTSGEPRRENAKACFRRMGGAKRYPSSHAPESMGIASLHPSYRLRGGLLRVA